MKEKLYTIPLQDAINAKTECPFCYIEQKIESDAHMKASELTSFYSEIEDKCNYS